MKKFISLICIIISIAVLINSNIAYCDSSSPNTNKSTLYPAYASIDNSMKWGYIDKTGKFIIEPQYTTAEEFSEGMAAISLDGKYGIINEKGEYIAKPIYDYIYISDGIACASGQNGSSAITIDGKTIFSSNNYIGEFKEGLAVFSKKVSESSYLHGYINKNGKVIIAPKFEWATNFQNGKALVRLPSGKYMTIDKKGDKVAEFKQNVMGYNISEDTVIYMQGENKSGYMSTSGKLITKAIFSNAGDFKDGYAIVNISNDYSNPKYGIINKKGQYVIKPQYGTIVPIGKGLFAVSKKGMISPMYDMFIPKAIMSIDGKILTDYKYYEIGELNNDLISVSDETHTYYINKKGQISNNFPKLLGIGNLKAQGDLIKATIDDEIVYMDRSGKIIWRSEDIYNLTDGTAITKEKYTPDRCMTIYYPVMKNNPDKAIEEKFNAEFKKLFLDHNLKSEKQDGEYWITSLEGFGVKEVGNLLIIVKDGYFYPIGAAHGNPSLEYYHFDIKTCKLFELKNLFKKDSNYAKALKQIIEKKIKENNAKEDAFLLSETVDITAEQGFTVGKESLEIYFQPYEIGPFAAGFPTFDIAYKDIDNLIDKDGEFWKAINAQ